MKIITVVGARPQFVKAAAFSHFAKNDSEIEEILIHTGQHFDDNMSSIFFQELNIPHPKYNLDINGGRHGDMTGKMLSGIEEILIKENPAVVLLYGDTNSTLAGALAAVKIGIPIAHVEAGLRSFNFNMPEEVNRIVADRLSSFLYCPTDQSMENLEKEGFKSFNVHIIKAGDVMFDATRIFSNLGNSESLVQQRFGINEYVICTIHRQESTESYSVLKNLMMGLDLINKEIPVIIPIHPRTLKVLKEFGISTKCRLISPLSYLEMLNFVKFSKLVLTDSGGLQKEAYFLKKNCVILRNETEWTELVASGYNVLAGYSSENIYDAFRKSVDKKLSFAEDFYGNGEACLNIIKDLKKNV